MASFRLTKCAENPILSPNPSNAWEARAVLNPAVAYCPEDGEFAMYYRAAGNDWDHLIHIGLATSRDGIHFTRALAQPVLSPQRQGFDGGCVEDPRITRLDGVTYMTYAYRPYPPGQYWLRTTRPTEAYHVSPNAPDALKENITSTALAILEDKTHIKRLGRITLSHVDDRDVMLFPEKIGGRYCRLSRPVAWSGLGYSNPQPAIWINFSHSLLDWDERQAILLMQAEQPWEQKKIGAGTPPIRTDAGWLMLYHGVDTVGKGIYRTGAVLLDGNDPAKVIARTREPIMEPEEDYELHGIYHGCVFPTSAVVREDMLYVYYGCADQYCCLATCRIADLTDYLLRYCRTKVL